MSKLQHMTSAYERGQIPPIQVHHRLRIAREWANLEQGELAERIGISRNSVSAAERGVTRPRKITINAWALATGVPASWLRTGEVPPDNGCPQSERRTADYKTVSRAFDVRQLSAA